MEDALGDSFSTPTTLTTSWGFCPFAFTAYVVLTNGTYIFVNCLVISRLISFRGLVRRS